MDGSPELAATSLEEISWTAVCLLDAILPGTGAAALIGGEQIAVVRAHDGLVYAISNFDPFSKAFVLARGIVGDRAGVPKIASPIYKQTFDLSTGQCLDDPEVRLRVYPVRVVAGRIELGLGQSSVPNSERPTLRPPRGGALSS